MIRLLSRDQNPGGALDSGLGSSPIIGIAAPSRTVKTQPPAEVPQKVPSEPNLQKSQRSAGSSNQLAGVHESLPASGRGSSAAAASSVQLVGREAPGIRGIPRAWERERGRGRPGGGWGRGLRFARLAALKADPSEPRSRARCRRARAVRAARVWRAQRAPAAKGSAFAAGPGARLLARPGGAARPWAAPRTAATAWRAQGSRRGQSCCLATSAVARPSPWGRWCH